jgi:hypothetical protein
VTKGQAVRWYTDPFAGPSMLYDAECSLIQEHGYGGFEIELLENIRSCSMSVITRYLQSLT